MSSRELEDRIRALGNSGNPPQISAEDIVAKGRVRRKHRRTTVIVAAVFVLVPTLTWMFVRRDGPGHGSRPVAAASGRTPTPAAAPRLENMAPGCPPGGPSLLSGPSATSAPLTQPIVAGAGTVVTLSAIMQASRPDRLVTSVRYIVGTPAMDQSVQGTNAAVLEAANQVTSVLVKAPSGFFTAELTIPATTAPGNYPIYVQYTWPGPSVCGVTNASISGSTQFGNSYRQAGTLSILPN
jgi:hypothetical protein